MPRCKPPIWCAAFMLVASVVCSGCGFDLLGTVPGGDGATVVAGGGVAPTGTSDGLPCESLGQPRTIDHQLVLDQLNAYRQAHGLQPLVYSKTLEAAADAMAADIVERDFFDHIDPDGHAPGDRAMRSGFCHLYVGENLASGFLSAAAVMQAWKDSPAHDENMLRPDYVHVGVGVVWTRRQGAVWVQEFALDPGTVVLATSRTLER